MALVSIIGIDEEKEFVVVAVVGSNDPIDPVTGGVGIVYLVVRTVAYNIESSSSVWPRGNGVCITESNPIGDSNRSAPDCLDNLRPCS